MIGATGTIHNITRRKQRENEITLLLSTTQAISRAVDVDNALLLILRLICQNIAWDFAEAWLPNKDGIVLEYKLGWCEQQSDLKTFYGSCEPLAFLKGDGLPGRIWLSKEPEWIEDLSVI
ncbi:MAG: hypothetical protein HC908_13970 [Calothrix sp. SM1_7_51]|nr:hypothetical protein [Calothrix sp. SM1_7_51]